MQYISAHFLIKFHAISFLCLNLWKLGFFSYELFENSYQEMAVDLKPLKNSKTKTLYYWQTWQLYIELEKIKNLILKTYLFIKSSYIYKLFSNFTDSLSLSGAKENDYFQFWALLNFSVKFLWYGNLGQLMTCTDFFWGLKLWSSYPKASTLW